MKKRALKIFALVMSMVIFLSVVPLNIFAAGTIVESGECGENVHYTLDSDGLLTISGEGEYSKTYFDSDTSITSVVIEDGITEIFMCAFSGYSEMTSITIPDSVKVIGSWAFEGCTSLSEIKMSKNIEKIGDYVFYNTEFYNDSSNWEDNILYIDYCLIEAKSSLTGVCYVRPGTRVIAQCAFAGCEDLTNVILPEGIKELNRGVFSNCLSLNKVVLPDTVTEIGPGAFLNCESLMDISLPEGITVIGKEAFCGCKALSDITIPDSICSIGEDAYWNTAVYNNDDNWENNVLYFNNCLLDAKDSISGILSVKPGTEIIADYAFSSTYTDHCVYKHNTSRELLGRITEFIGYVFFENITGVIIPDSVTHIGNGAFFRCTNLNEVYLGNNISEIGYGAFEECPNLSIVTIASKNISAEGAFYNNSDKLTFVVSEKNTDIINYTNSSGIPVVEFGYSESEKQLSFNGNIVVCEGLEYNYLTELIKEYPDAEKLYFKRLEFDGVQPEAFDFGLEITDIDIDNINIDKKSEDLAYNNLYVSISVIRNGKEEKISFGKMFELLESGDYDAFKMNLNSDEEVTEQTFFEKVVQAIKTFFEDVINLIKKIVNWIVGIFR